jgi:caa(3)-type oxidase subunit IV
MRFPINNEIVRTGWAWLALMLLLGATTGLAFLPLGRMQLATALLVSTAKSAIVLAVFMRLWRGPDLGRLFAAVGIGWFAIMLILTWADYLTRSGPPFAAGLS